MINRKFRELKTYTGLLRMPLLRRTLMDLHIEIIPRAVDCEWNYERIAIRSVTGFNPSQRKIYIGSNSAIASWLKGKCVQDRAHNEGDFLTKEVLFLMHDYLHSWAYLVIQDEMPELKFGSGEINDKSAETFAFCHLLTEAVATVGLDYWYLSTLDLTRFCDLGTNRTTLTVSYHEQDLQEFQQFNADFEVQTPEFFSKIVHFYCSGKFPDFTVDHLKKSPKLQTWLAHELKYGEDQREYTRAWLNHLSGIDTITDKKSLLKEIPVNQNWQKDLIKKVGDRLWNLIKNDKDVKVKKPLPAKSRLWKRSRGKKSTNFCFTNLNKLDPDQGLEISDPDHFQYFSCQFMSSYLFKDFPRAGIPILRLILEKRQVNNLIAFFKLLKMKRIPLSSAEESDIFFLN